MSYLKRFPVDMSVESALQMETLTELGCDKAQGYFFCRPQHPAAITRHLLHEHQPAVRAGHRTFN